MTITKDTREEVAIGDDGEHAVFSTFGAVIAEGHEVYCDRIYLTFEQIDRLTAELAAFRQRHGA